MDHVEISVTNPKLKRTLERFKAKIVDGDFYEAHQTLRTIANRNVRSKSYNDAIDLLYNGAQILLKSSQPATGSDLTSYLIEVFVESETKVANETKSKLIQLISLFEPDEPTVKKVGVEAINWSIKFGDNRYGDPDLHYALGSKFLGNGDLVYDAEKHLLLGNSSGFSLYLDLIWEWYLEDPDETQFGAFVNRIVLNYLLIQNFKNAHEALTTLLSKFIGAKPSFQHETVKEFNQQVEIFEQLPTLNLLQLLLITIQTTNAQFFQRLTQRYAKDIQEKDVSNAYVHIGEIYFNIVPQRQGNVLQDLMSSFLSK